MDEMILKNTSSKIDYSKFNGEELYKTALQNMQSILEEYKKDSDSIWTIGTLKMNQQADVNGKQGFGSLDASVNGSTVKCPLSGVINIVHHFESTQFVPIPNTPYKVYELGSSKPVAEGKLDSNGTATIKNLKPDVYYQISLYSKISKADLDNLYQSYQGMQQDLTNWLTEQWNDDLKKAWNEFDALSEDGKLKAIQAGNETGTLEGALSALVSLWTCIRDIIDFISSPKEHTIKAFDTLIELNQKIFDEAAPQKIHDALIVAHDQIYLYLHAITIYNWYKLLPPQIKAEIDSKIISTIICNILLIIITKKITGTVTEISVNKLKTALSATNQDRIRKTIISVAKATENRASAHFPIATKLFVGGSGSASKSIASVLQIGNKKFDNAISFMRNSKAWAKIKTIGSEFKQAAKQAELDSKMKSDAIENTAVDKCPVSMVTGEELLTLNDGVLGGVFPFTFQRTYRSSAAESNQGMGYGWSHTLTHLLTFQDGAVFWRDHEGRTIEFPEPTEQAPAIINPLAKAAIWLGRRKDEVVLSQPNQPYYHFVRKGNIAQLQSLTDQYGNRLLIHYDDQGLLRRVELPGVHALQFYFSQGLLQRIDRCVSDPDSPTRTWQQHLLVRYHYNEQKQLIAAENALGEAERYRYNEQHVIQERQLAGGVQFFWEWEFEGKHSRCIRHWSPQAGFDSAYAWDDKGTVTITNIDGSEEVYQHDDRAKLIAKKDPDGAELKKAYDEDGNLIAETDALGHTTTYRYDTNGKLEAVIAPDGQVTEYDYHKGFIRKITQGDAIWYYQRNEAGDIEEQTTPDGVTTRYRHSPTGQLLAVIYADGSQHQLVYNRFGQLIEEKDPQGGTQKYRYDAQGRMVLSQNAKGAITRYAYDALDRVTDIQLPTGGQRRYSYNAYGKVTSFTNERGQTTRYEYGNQLHLVTAQHNPDGSVLRFAYHNPKLFLSDITNERGEQYQLRYYPNGLVESEIDFAGRKTGYVYDLNGKLIEKQEFSCTDDTVLVTRFARDPMGRLLTKTLPDGSAIEYRYDTAGRLVSVSDGNWPLHYEYDVAGRLVAEHQGFATTRYGYNAMGQLDRCKFPDGNLLSYGYFRGGLLQGIDLNGNPLSRHDYTDGLETRRQLGILQGLYQYDEQGRLREQKVQLARPAPNAFKVQRRYHYDALGNLSKLEDSHKGTREFFYDPLDRLTQVRGAVEEFFSHDMAGNLLSQFAKNPQAAETAGNRLQFQGDRHFEYDGFGNLIAEKRGKGQQLVTRYHYDCQHRLVKLEKYDGTIAHYKYDAFGRRIEKQVSHAQSEPDDLNSNVVSLNQTTQAKPVTEKTTFLWQANRLIAETNHKNNYRSFIYEPGTYKPLAQLEGKGKNAEVYYYHLDHLGTPQELTSTHGKLVWAVQYRAYGNVVRTIANDIETPLRFQGQYFDAESGLHYNRHRYYQPETGRFLTPDPIKLAGGLNNYQYVSNPVNWVDPLGLACVKENGVNDLNVEILNPSPGTLNGEPELPHPNSAPDMVRSLNRQNESAEILSKHGLDVTHLPNTGKKGGNPDLSINNRPADVYSPTSKNPNTIRDNMTYKVGHQSSDIVLNLTDSPLSPTDMIKFLEQKPIIGLKKLYLIDGNTVLVKEY